MEVFDLRKGYAREESTQVLAGEPTTYCHEFLDGYTRRYPLISCCLDTGYQVEFTKEEVEALVLELQRATKREEGIID